MGVSYLGPPGSFSEQAARKYFEGTEIQLVECASFSDVFRAVLSNQSTYGIVPVENSTTGRVQQVSSLRALSMFL